MDTNVSEEEWRSDGVEIPEASQPDPEIEPQAEHLAYHLGRMLGAFMRGLSETAPAAADDDDDDEE